MQRVTVLAVSCFFLVAMPVQVLADISWCFTNHPDAIFCEDFDRYCSNAPPWPETCSIGDPRTAMGDWLVPSNCGWVPGVNDNSYSSAPYDAKIGCQDGGNQLGYANMPLTNFVKTRFGSAYTSTLATDLTPLTMEFALNGRDGIKIDSANLYVELGNGRAGLLATDAYSLANWIISPDCVPCGDTSGNTGYWPILCRQSPTPAGCADVSTAPITPAIAVGVLAFLDTNPCHCGESVDHWPQAYHLAFFDGRQWWTLPASFTDPGGSQPATGNFSLMPGDIEHRIRLTINSTSVIVEMRVGSPVVLSRCEVPLVYTGPFNTILMGMEPPCQVTPGTWTCNGAPDCNGACGRDQSPQICCLRGAPGGGTMTIDDLALYGGQGYADEGACCFPDTHCEIHRQGDCQVLGGQPGPAGSTCQNHACCPALPPDHNMDGYVDLQDFGWFQTCLAGPEAAPPTVPCQCVDFNKDGHVDDLDLATFLGCMLGPGVQANPNCTH